MGILFFCVFVFLLHIIHPTYHTIERKNCEVKRMKKWMVLLLAVVAAVSVFWLSGAEESPVEVTVERIAPQRAEQTVSCTGLVEAADSTPVLMPFSCVMEQVAVKEGQRVQKGDLLAVMDKEATRELVSPEMVVVLAATETNITAPEDGVVMTVGAVEGETLVEGTPCAVLVCDQDIQVRVAIPEKHLPDLTQGMAVRVTGSGFEKAVYTGSLLEIAAAAQTDLSGGTVVQGVVTLDAPDDSLRVGLNARVEVVTAVDEDALVLPYEAVLTDEQGEYVYVVEEGCARRVDVSESVQVGNGLLVTDVTFDGAAVITQPDKITRDGQPIREVTA